MSEVYWGTYAVTADDAELLGEERVCAPATVTAPAGATGSAPAAAGEFTRRFYPGGCRCVVVWRSAILAPPMSRGWRPFLVSASAGCRPTWRCRSTCATKWWPDGSPVPTRRFIGWKASHR